MAYSPDQLPPFPETMLVYLANLRAPVTLPPLATDERPTRAILEARKQTNDGVSTV